MTSEIGAGTCTTIHFPQARARAAAPTEVFDIPAAE
jgi:hypothetical protein